MQLALFRSARAELVRAVIIPSHRLRCHGEQSFYLLVDDQDLEHLRFAHFELRVQLAPPKCCFCAADFREASMVLEHEPDLRADSSFDDVVGGAPSASALLGHLDEGEHHAVSDQRLQGVACASQAFVDVLPAPVLQGELPKEPLPYGAACCIACCPPRGNNRFARSSSLCP